MPGDGASASSDTSSNLVSAEETFKQLGEERIQKLLARSGFGSRRKCEELILQGRVTVNGEVRAQLGAKADLYKDKVAVDGEIIRAPKPVYYVINKPKGWYCTDDVPDKRLLDLIPEEQPRIFTVGRLDKTCEGLMLATNDGRIANMLTHPRFNVPKVYKVFLQGHIKFETIAEIERALFYAINGGAFERIKVLKRNPRSSSVRLIVYEGLPSSFRDICVRYGHPISRIVRIKVGPLELGTLASGDVRKLRGDEIVSLISFANDIERGRIKRNDKRLVTAQSLKRQTTDEDEAGDDQDDDRTDFEPKARGHQGKPSVGQRKMRTEIGQAGSGQRSSRDTARQ